MRDFLAITGPTTSGKTQVSIAVAEALDGEIISMDHYPEVHRVWFYPS